MKLTILIGALALACVTAFSASTFAATTADAVVPFELVAPVSSVDCFASFEPSTAIVFVEAQTNCDAVMAELTGVYLAPVAIDHLPLRVAAVLDPVEGLTCTSTRPSPPG